MCKGTASSTALLTAFAAVTISSIERCARRPPRPTSRHNRSIRRTAQNRLVVVVMMVVVVVIVMMVMVMIVAIVVVVVVMMVVLGKFHVRTLDLWIDQFRRGLSDVRGHQERKRIGDGIKELGIGPRRREFTRVGKCLCGGLGAVERRQSRDHPNHANNLLVHGLLLGFPTHRRGAEN